MSPPSSDVPRERDEVLSRILKAIRTARRLTVQRVADGMDLKKRTYERFEAGETLLRAERVFAFAAATDSDPYAIWASVKLGTPDFALACMDSKLMMLLVAHARDLFSTHGPAMGTLQAQVVVEALRPAFDLMRQEIERSRATAAKWLGDDDSLASPRTAK